MFYLILNKTLLFSSQNTQKHENYPMKVWKNFILVARNIFTIEIALLGCFWPFLELLWKSLHFAKVCHFGVLFCRFRQTLKNTRFHLEIELWDLRISIPKSTPFFGNRWSKSIFISKFHEVKVCSIFELYF